MKSLYLLSFFVSLAVCNVSCTSGIDPMTEDSLMPGWHEGNLQHDGLERVFLFYVPENLPDNPPAVILLHGGTQSMYELFDRNGGGTKEWPEVAEDEGFLLLVPNGTNIETGSPTGDHQNWNDCRKFGPDADDVGFIAALISWADQKVNINNDRVYATGSSNGGMMSYRLARELDDMIAAVAAFIANKPKNNECSGSPHSIPVMIVNGTADPLMPYYGGKLGNRDRGKVLSTQATVDYWAIQIGVSTEPTAVDSLPNINQGNDSHVIRLRYGSAQLGAQVVLYKVVDGGHMMPTIEHPFPNWVEKILGNQNNDVEGARIAWKFLNQHAK